MIAAHRQLLRTRAVDRQMIGNAQLSAGESDCPEQSVGELDAIRAGLSIGIEDGLAQGSQAAVGDSMHGEIGGRCQRVKSDRRERRRNRGA